MDFPGACMTGVLKVDSCSATPYRVYGLVRDDILDANGSSSSDSSQVDLLRHFECLCRDKRGLVNIDIERRQLWLFGDEEKMRKLLLEIGIDGDETQTTVTEVDGMKIQRLKSGIFQSASLTQQTSPLAKIKNGPVSAPPAPATFEQNIHTSRFVNARAAFANRSLSATAPPSATMVPLSTNLQDHIEDLENPKLIYKHLMASTVSLISYCLAQNYGYIPLNFCTFVVSISVPDTHHLDSPSDCKCPPSEPIFLTTLDVRLTTTGTLLVVPKTVRQPGLVPVALKSPSPNEKGMWLESDVWLAPGGKIARYLGVESPMETCQTDNFENEKGLRKRHDSVKAQTPLSADGGTWRWKADVIGWLKQKGINLTNLGESSVWVRVAVWIHVDEDLSLDDGAEGRAHDGGGLRIVLWPETLCFKRATPPSSARVSEVTEPTKQMQWLKNATEETSLDPLTFVETWYAQKEVRQQELNKREEARQAKRPLTNQRPQDPNGIAQYGSSEELPQMATLGPRPSTIGDVHTASGVYPTPPDGIQAQAISGGGPFEPSEPAVDNAVGGIGLEAGPKTEAVAASPNNEDSRMDADLWSTSEEQKGSTATRKESNATVFDISSGNFATGDGGPSFGHLDEDMFNEIGVTEADFSFFDGPDIGDDDFPDGSAFPREMNKNKFPPGDDMGAFGAPLSEPVQEGALTSVQGIASRAPHHDLKSLGESNDQTKSGTQTSDARKLNVDLTGGIAPIETEKDQSRSREENLSIDENKVEGRVMSPPLSPTLVMKRLLPKTVSKPSSADSAHHLTSLLDADDRKKNGHDGRNLQDSLKANDFDPIQFNTAIDATKDKYDLQGRFGFSTYPDTAEIASTKNETVPRLGLEHRRQGQNTIHRQFPRATFNEAGTTTGVDSSKVFYDSSLDSGSFIEKTTEYDELSEGTGHYSDGVRSPALKRKRTMEEDEVLTETSLQHSGSETALDSPGSLLTTPISLDCLGADIADWPMAGIFSSSAVERNRIFELNDREFINTAQIVADQVVSATIETSPWASYFGPNLEDEVPLTETLSWQGQCSVKEILRESFSRAIECDLEAYVAIVDAAPEPSLCGSELSSRLHLHPRKTNSNQKSEASLATSSEVGIFRIPTTHVQIQRGETTVEILPPALPFWESFGLGPISGPKDVTSFCVYLSTPGVAESVNEFLERMGSVYESCRLGCHRRGDVFAYYGGCVPVEINAPDPGGTGLETALQGVKDTCIRLGQLLPNLDMEPQNVVIYLVNPFSHADAIVDLCVAFSALFYAYSQSPAVQQSTAVHEIVLQIVPLRFMASESTIPVPTQAQYFKLGLEVYERCALMGSEAEVGFLGGRPSPAVLLAPSLPNRINFKLSAEPPQSLLQENCCLHIAYSCSVDDRWISVAWSDSVGGLQTCTSFCLRRSEASTDLRPFAEVAKEVWDTSVGMIRFKNVTWRFMLIKVGVMDEDEMDVWNGLAAHPSQPCTTLALLSAEPQPSLSLHIAASIFTPNSFLQQTATYTTPVSTPPQRMQSPDPPNNGPAGTPTEAGVELDADATIVDVMDDVWALILGHRWRNSHSIVDFQPALATGLLVKRGGPHDEGPPTCLGVNVLQAQRAYEPLLREMLGVYRGLSTLARFRGTEDPVTSVLPWHIAAAVRAQEALSSLM